MQLHFHSGAVADKERKSVFISGSDRELGSMRRLTADAVSTD
jgi:hypothetical protein